MEAHGGNDGTNSREQEKPPDQELVQAAGTVGQSRRKKRPNGKTRKRRRLKAARELAEGAASLLALPVGGEQRAVAPAPAVALAAEETARVAPVQVIPFERNNNIKECANVDADPCDGE